MDCYGLLNGNGILTMIVTKIYGGLGNQMFQYAAGRRLALKRGLPLFLDLSYFVPGAYRTYGLCHFNINAVALSAEQAARLNARFGGGLARKLWVRLQEAMKGKGRFQYIMEKAKGIDQRVLDAQGNVCLIGFWQSEDYFADVPEAIRSEFVLNTPLCDKSRNLLEQIANSHSVSVHVRRGDYVSDPTTNSIHGTCDSGYYQKAFTILERDHQDLCYFVFSDDLAWAREHLTFSRPVVYVDHNGPDHPHEDLRVMSLCKHHVIANSSLSWWGAWLNPNPNKRVIAPQRWYRDTRKDNSDIVPQAWQRV